MPCPASRIAVCAGWALGECLGNGALKTGTSLKFPWLFACASGGSRLPRRLDGVPDPLRCRRHVEMDDAVARQRVGPRAHHGGGRGDGADFAATLDAEGIVPATGTLREHRDLRQVIGAR